MHIFFIATVHKKIYIQRKQKKNNNKNYKQLKDFAKTEQQWEQQKKKNTKIKKENPPEKSIASYKSMNSSWQATFVLH